MKLEASATLASTMRQWLGFVARGMLIGVADLFPGVSGGTMALLTGVYVRFINALASLHSVLLLCMRGKILQGLRSIDWFFVTAIGCGALIAIVSFSEVVAWLLDNYQSRLMSFFTGIVLYTAYALGCKLTWRVPIAGLVVVGFCVAFFLRELAAIFAFSQGLGEVFFFFGGAVAICAMLLPGISGSLLLLMLGMYQPVIGAIAERDVAVLGFLGLGAVFGLLAFAPLLRYSYHRFYYQTLAVLTGLTCGAVRETAPVEIMTSPSGTELACILFGVIIGKCIDYFAKDADAPPR